MNEKQLIDLALQYGFSAAVISTDAIVFDPSFRPFCEQNLCGQYGANYSCPPDCGTPKEMENRIRSKNRALVLQTVWPVADYTDAEAIRSAIARFPPWSWEWGLSSGVRTFTSGS